MPYQTGWRCKRCGSTEQRTPRTVANRKSPLRGCAECHRRAAKPRPQITGLTAWETRIFRALERDHFDDIVITVPCRVYLAAFNAYLLAVQAGDRRAARQAAAARFAALNHLEDRKTDMASVNTHG
jgi:hypothetical protein